MRIVTCESLSHQFVKVKSLYARTSDVMLDNAVKLIQSVIVAIYGMNGIY